MHRYLAATSLVMLAFAAPADAAHGFRSNGSQRSSASSPPKKSNSHPSTSSFSGTSHKSSHPTTVKLPSGKRGNITTSQYAAHHGTKFKKGFYFKGHGHRHWTARHYLRGWKTWCWYCPSTKCWYYWAAGQSAYMPIETINDNPPTPTGTTPENHAALPTVGPIGTVDAE